METQQTTQGPYISRQGQLNAAALLLARGIKQKDLAKKYFINVTELNKVLWGKRKTPHIRQAVAMELGLSVDELWGKDQGGDGGAA